MQSVVCFGVRNLVNMESDPNTFDESMMPLTNAKMFTIRIEQEANN